MSEKDFIKLIKAGFIPVFVKDGKVFQIGLSSFESVEVLPYKDQKFKSNEWAEIVVTGGQIWNDKVIFLNPSKKGFDYLNA